jgi:hypothetical protein
MGSQKTPEVIHPAEAAKAAIGTAAAGEQMAIANQPIEQFSNLATNIALGPAQIRSQQALANRAALMGAQAQRDIQSQVDPYAFAQREMRMQAANKRLGELYNQDPASVSYRAPQAYGMPGTADVPTLEALRQQGAAIGSNLSTAKMGSGGENPQIVAPRKPQDLPQTQGYGYY